MDVFDHYGLITDRLIAGLMGGATHIFLDKWAGWYAATGSIVCGISAANYLGDLPYNYGMTVFGKSGSVYLVGAFASLILRLLGHGLNQAMQFAKAKNGG